MIDRYSRPAMVRIFTDTHRYQLWLEVEKYAAEKMAEMGTIPNNLPKLLEKLPALDNQATIRILEIEKTTKHDVIAFLTFIAEKIGDDARFLHQGMTSSDVLDTALALQMTEAIDLLLKDMVAVMTPLKKLADEHKNTLTMGRSHGMHAEPISFGFKMLGHYAAFGRMKQRLENAKTTIATCKIRGPVGSFSSVAPEVEQYVAKKLNLAVEPHATQVIPRDRHAEVFTTLMLLAGVMENIAIEIRHLQRTEVNEAQEFFAEGQKGSSAMPHKKNPILSENLTGLARLIRSYGLAGLENIALWHERDISHSSVERVIVPDGFILADFALDRLAGLLSQLQVNEKQMADNMQSSQGIYHSGALLNGLTQKGVKREEAYLWVQESAIKTHQQAGDFIGLVSQHPAIAQHLSQKEIADICQDKNYLKHIETIYEKVYTAYKI